MDKLILFDIDGTLTLNENLGAGHGHDETLLYVLESLFNRKIKEGQDNTAGMTDQQIIRLVLKRNGIPEKEIDEKMGLVIEEMEKHFRQEIGNFSFRVIDGIRDVLEELQSRGVLMGLVTGNL
ncbi:MAG: HAD family hydrolase, partial [Candidatus Aenigmarchaeota archaeon]|nr:HAD family hydrolase [Candidatus Aenigmarchaeota archaeon]